METEKSGNVTEGGHTTEAVKQGAESVSKSETLQPGESRPSGEKPAQEPATQPQTSTSSPATEVSKQ